MQCDISNLSAPFKFHSNHHYDGNTPVIVYDYKSGDYPLPLTRIEHSFFAQNTGELIDSQSGSAELVANVFYENVARPNQKTNFITNNAVSDSSFIVANNKFVSNDSSGARTSFWLIATVDPAKLMSSADLLVGVTDNCASDNIITGTYATVGIAECNNGAYAKGKWPDVVCLPFSPCSFSAPPQPCDAFREASCSMATDSPTPAPSTPAPTEAPSPVPTAIIIQQQPTQPSLDEECSPPNFELCGDNPSHYYLNPDPSRGSDANDGKSANAPLLTISRAIEIANSDTSSSFVFHLAGGDYGEFGLGPWTNPFVERRSSTSWIQFVGSTPNDGSNPVVFSNVEINNQAPVNCRVVLRGAKIVGTAPGSSGDNNAIEVRRSNMVRIDNVLVDPQNPVIWNSFAKKPQGLYTREASNIIFSNSSINGGRYGIVLGAIGRHLQVVGCEIHHQFEDAIRVVSVDDVLIRDNHIHDVDDYQNTGQHIDGIQFFPSGRSGRNYYPQSRNVTIHGNTFTNMVGQMIFVQAKYIPEIGYMQDITISNNILAPKIVNDASIPIQVQGVQNYVFKSNTVTGKVLIRLQSSGKIISNVFGELDVTEQAEVLSGSDSNVIGILRTPDSGAIDMGSSIISTTLYANTEAFDFAPTTLDACSNGLNGLHAGAVPCRPCEWATSSGPIANFKVDPGRIDSNAQSVTLLSSSSSVCGESELASAIVSTSDGRMFALSSFEDVTTICLPSPGIYSFNLVVSDSNGAQDSITRHAIKESPTTSLIANYPLSSMLLADISSNRYEDAVFDGPGTSTIASGACLFDSYTDMSFDDNIILPKSVGDSINLKSAFTAVVWARPTAPGQLLYKHATVGIWVESASRVYFSVGTNANATHAAWFRENAAAASFDLDGEWHQYVVAFDRGEIRGFIDGNLVASATVPSSYASEVVKEGSWDMVLGFRTWKGRNFVGGIKGFQIYDRALSPEEMSALFVADGVDCNAHNTSCPPEPSPCLPSGSSCSDDSQCCSLTCKGDGICEDVNIFIN